MQVYCCCSIAHQPRLAGEKALFTSVTAAMSKTSRTMKSTQKIIAVVFLPLNIRPEYLQDHCRCKQWYQFRNISSSATALWTAMFCCASGDYDGRSILAQHVLSCARMITCENPSVHFHEKPPRSTPTVVGPM
jgi:hypothetical protein